MNGFKSEGAYEVTLMERDYEQHLRAENGPLGDNQQENLNVVYHVKVPPTTRVSVKVTMLNSGCSTSDLARC